MKIVTVTGLALSSVLTGCTLMPNNVDYQNIEAIEHANKTYLEKEQVIALIKDLQSENSRRIDVLNWRVQQLSDQLESLNSNQQTAQSGGGKSAETYWECELKPTFQNKKFTARALHKVDAVFKVVEQCVNSGVNSVYCDTSDADCDENSLLFIMR